MDKTLDRLVEIIVSMKKTISKQKKIIDELLVINERLKELTEQGEPICSNVGTKFIPTVE